MALLVDLYQQYNNVTDWSALAGVVSGAYLKYSDGAGGAHTPADGYAAGCRRVGIPYGGYHFAEPGDAAAQARVLIGQYQRLGGQLAPALDLESGGIPPAARGAFARQFLETVHQAYPIVVLYASGSWLASLDPDAWPYPWDRTWAAEYGVNNGARNALRAYRGRVDLHQYTSVGKLAGVSGHVDLDYTDDLSALLLTAPGLTSTVEDAMPAIPYDYQATGTKDAAGNVPERCHVFTLPVGAVSLVVARAWLSFKSAVGPAKRVRLMAIAGGTPPGGRYLVDQTWADVPCDAQRPVIEAPSPCDQFTAFVQCEYPYSLCVETKAK